MLTLFLLCLSIFGPSPGQCQRQLYQQKAEEWTSKAQPVPNIGFLGRGYDIIRGNPRPTDESIDSGFVNSIFEVNQFPSYTSADFRYLIPENTELDECQVCMSDMTTNFISGENSYRKSLLSQVLDESSPNVSLLYFASFETSFSKTKLEQNEEILVDTLTSCPMFCARLQLYNQPRFTENFKNSIKWLVNDTEIIIQFLKTFGTHVVTKVNLGGLHWQRSIFDRLQWKKMASLISLSDIEMASKTVLQTELKKLNQNSVFPTNGTIVEVFRNFSKSIMFHSIGSPTSQLPIKMSLMSILDLFTFQNFPYIENITLKRSYIEQVMNNQYCYAIQQSSVGQNVDDCYSTSDEGMPKFSTFGGFFCMNCNRHKIGLLDKTNKFTGNYNCPTGFNAHPLMVGRTPEIAMLVVCLMNNSLDEGTFGGVFTDFDCNGGKGCNINDQVAKPNPVTGNFSCPQGYEAQSITQGTIDDCCRQHPGNASIYNVYVCYRKMSLKSIIGGFYSLDRLGKPRTLNPVTFSVNCQQGFTSAMILQGYDSVERKHPEVIDGFVCVYGL